MRPLVVSHTGAAGGSNDVILSLLRNRPPDVEPVCAFLHDGPAAQEVRDLGMDARVIDAGRARQAWRAASASYALLRLIRARAVDVVLSHASKAQVYASPSATVARVPNLWWQHEVPGIERGAPGRTRVLQAIAGRLPTSAVVCSSRFVAQLHEDHWPGTPVRCINPGVRCGDVAIHRHTDRSAAVIAVVCRLQRWKRVDRALDAFALVVAAEPAARLRIVGAARPDVDADYPAQLHARAAALGVAHAVEFAGELTEVEDQLAGADLLLHVADREAFGLTLVEALLRGIPVLAPPLGGAPEIVRHGIDGIIVDPDDTRALADALLALVRAPERRAAMGAAGRARVLEHFDERRTAGRLWELVAEIAARGRSR